MDDGDRAEIIWTDADIAALKKACPAQVADAVDLASYSLAISCTHVGDDAITMAAGKSRGPPGGNYPAP